MRSLLGVLTILLSLAAPAAATTYRMVSDTDLADQAPVIVEAVVTAAGTSSATTALATDYQVEVERWLRGEAAGGSLTVRVPGGQRPGGMGLKIWGAPALRVGERALLFLVPKADGSFHILHLMLGAFHVESAGDGRRLAVRYLSEAKEVGGQGEDRPRDLERFRTWLADRAAGSRRAGDYFVQEDFTRPIHAPFNLLDAGGVKLRWFDFDAGGSVSWNVSRAGQPGVAGGGSAELQRALEAWNAEPSTPIHFAFVGGTNATGGLERFDGINTISFDQPVADAFDCDHGGILAIGGPWYDAGQRASWDGEEFIPITGADIVTNTGISCWLNRSRDSLKAAEELFGHELGHTLGLAHSCGDAGSGDCAASADRSDRNDALMRAYIHNDGRGARLGGDDRAALQALYRPGAGQATLAPPTAPGNLTAEQAGLTVRLLWEDRATGEEGFRVYRSAGGARPASIGKLPAGATFYVDSTVQPGTRYEYQVAAFNAKGESRGTRVVLAVPRAEPLQALALISETPAVRTGEPAVFSAAFSGPARRARWDFGSGVGFSDSPCAPEAFCATHIFAEPGEHTVRVRLLGDLGQMSERTMRIRVEGPPLALTSLASTPAGGSFLPSVLSGSRGGDAVFRSDLSLFNDGPSPTLVRIAFQSRGVPAPRSWRDVTLAPGASLLIPDVLRELFGVSGQGSLSLTYLLPASASATGAAPRIFAFSRPHAPGSFGPRVGEEPEAGWSAEEKIAAGLLQGGGMAAILLVANLDATAGQLTVDLLDGEGRPVGSPARLSLGPHANRSQRLDRLFPEVERHTGPFSARFRSDGIRFSAAANLFGGELETEVFLPALSTLPSALPDGTQGELFIPRVARGAGAFGTFQFSKLVVSNPSPQPREIHCELRLQGPGGGDARVVTLTLPPLASILVEDALRDLFALTEAAGSLRISWNGQGGPAPRVLSLAVSSPRGGTGRRFAALVDSLRVEDTAAARVLRSTRAINIGAEPSSLVRTSYGAVNLGSQPAVLRLSLKDSAGSVLRTARLPLAPKQHFERDLLAIFPGAGSGRWTVTAEVVSGGPVTAYLLQTGAGGDLSFVPGSLD
jgi:PKD domain